MRKDIIQTGATVEEAINSACLRLGYRREECEWDIIDLPKSSFFGLKKIPAKVKVWITLTEEQMKKEKSLQEQIEKANKPKVDPPKVDPPKATQPKPEIKQPPKATPAKPKIEPQPKEKPVLSIPTNVAQTEAARGKEPEDHEKSRISVEYLKEMISNMGIEASIEPKWENEGLTLAVSGKGLGALIGRRGDNLNAIQYLVGLVANRLEGEYLRVTVDCGDYRLKRNSALEEMAIKSAQQVIKTNLSKTLEPMNPAERRMIHSTISDIDGVSSISVGKDPFRRVMIKTPTSINKARSGGNRDRDRDRGDRPRNNHGNRNRKPRENKDSYVSKPVKEADPVVPEISSTQAGKTPLYGKIEL